jgi:pfkB family carbohydrate kinase
MRIGILGQPCIDEIVHPGKRSLPPDRALGGVLYSYAAMERLIRERGSAKDSFVPLTWFSYPDREFLETLLGTFVHMDHTSGLWPTDSLTNRVQLVYQKDGHRSEHCPHILPPLTQEHITPTLLDSLDGLFINMISGFDIALDTLEATLSKTKERPHLHLDIHALVLGPLSQVDADQKFGGGRQPRGVVEWRRWLALADSVQMNEFEARWFADPELRTEEELLRAIERMDANERPKQVIVTRAANGASVYDFDAGEAHHVPPAKVDALETTGSGDVFGSAYIFSVLAGGKPEEALREAVNWATWNTTLPSIEQILDAQLFQS